MSATDELRRLLDEHGVEHEDSDDNLVYNYTTRWSIGRCNVEYSEYRSGVTRMVATCISPEQAVEVTIGKTTTRNGKIRKRYGRDVPLCECCGYAIGDARYNYCPSCGALIIE